MLAVKAIFADGVVSFLEEVPSAKSEVIVIFPEIMEPIKANTSNNEITVKNVLDKFRGRLNLDGDEKEIKREAAIEKYESIN